MTAFDLTESILGIHRRLEAQLRERRQIPHPTPKGGEGELLWLRVHKVREHTLAHTGLEALDMVLCLEGGLFEPWGLPPDPPEHFERGPTSFVLFLFLFLYSLLHRLQRLATVPAVVWPGTARGPGAGEA